MARSPSTPRKSNSTITQADRVARRLARQQKQLEKEMLNDMGVKVAPTGGRMVKLSDVKKLEPLTDTQADFFEAWDNDDADAYLLHGSAGTGKSFMAMYFALQEVLKPNPVFSKIIVIRSAVPTRNQGFLPGSLDEKMEVFEQPYIQICAELTNNKAAYEKLKEVGKIEFVSSSYLRGMTFNDSIVIVDEAQGMTFHEISSIMTRIGQNTKLICCGDGKQDDLITNKNDVSGFRDFVAATRSMSEFRSFRFTVDDIVRSGFVRSWIIACEKLGL